MDIFLPLHTQKRWIKHNKKAFNIYSQTLKKKKKGNPQAPEMKVTSKSKLEQQVGFETMVARRVLNSNTELRLGGESTNAHTETGNIASAR